MSTTRNARPPWAAPYEVRKGAHFLERGQTKLKRHAILHYLRGCLEERHRSQLETYQVYAPHRLNDMSHLGEILGLNCWNKTVPVFLLKGPAGSAGHNQILQPALHNYLYRRWFHPYRTDIEYGQFIAHIFNFRD